MSDIENSFEGYTPKTAVGIKGRNPVTPIFDITAYGTIDDLLEVIPALAAEPEKA